MKMERKEIIIDDDDRMFLWKVNQLKFVKPCLNMFCKTCKDSFRASII